MPQTKEKFNTPIKWDEGKAFCIMLEDACKGIFIKNEDDEKVSAERQLLRVMMKQYPGIQSIKIVNVKEVDYCYCYEVTLQFMEKGIKCSTCPGDTWEETFTLHQAPLYI